MRVSLVVVFRIAGMGAALAGGLVRCGPPPAATGPDPPTQVIAAGTPMSNACYAGSTAEVGYDRAISWDRVAEVWRRNGWRRSDPVFPATDYQIVGFAAGSFDDPQGAVVVSANRTDHGGTRLTVLVARSTGDVSQHPRQAKEAVEVLDRFRKPLEKELGLPPAPVYVGWNGCR